jgi:hypothetical protein
MLAPFPKMHQNADRKAGLLKDELAESRRSGRLSALGIIMIFISTTLVVLATLVGAKLRTVEA